MRGERRRLGTPLAVCAVGALLLNAAVLIGAAAIGNPAKRPIARTAAPTVLAMTLRSGEPAPASPGTEQANAQQRELPSTSTRRQAPAVPSPTPTDRIEADRFTQRVGSVAMLVPGAEEPPTSGDALDVSRYLPSEAVDIPATPVAEWRLQPSTTDAIDAWTLGQGEAPRLVFTILVDPDGTPRQCALERSAEALPEELARIVEEELCSTEMRPALRGGAAVANRRRIELALG